MNRRLSLVEEINFGVNHSIACYAGRQWEKSPRQTIQDKQGSYGDVALLKLRLLQSKGVPASDLMLGTSQRDNKTYAIVKSSYKPWWSKNKRPCLLVLFPDVHKAYRLGSTKYIRNSESLKMITYVKALAAVDVGQNGSDL